MTGINGIYVTVALLTKLTWFKMWDSKLSLWIIERRRATLSGNFDALKAHATSEVKYACATFLLDHATFFQRIERFPFKKLLILWEKEVGHFALSAND